MKKIIKPKLEVLVGPEENNVVVPTEHSESLERALRAKRLSFTVDRKGIIGSLGSDDVFNFIYEEDVAMLQRSLDQWSNTKAT